MDTLKLSNWIRENIEIVVFTLFATLITALIAIVIYQSAVQPKEGVVIRKDYQPPYTSTHYRTITQSDGKRIEVPMQEYHDARYQIVIKGINAKGEESHGYYYVTPVEYENINIGDYYVKQRE